MVLLGILRINSMPYAIGGGNSSQGQIRTRYEPEAKEKRTRVFEENRVLRCFIPPNTRGHPANISRIVNKFKEEKFLAHRYSEIVCFSGDIEARPDFEKPMLLLVSLCTCLLYWDKIHAQILMRRFSCVR